MQAESDKFKQETLKVNNRKYFDRNYSEILDLRKQDKCCNWRSLRTG